MRVLDLCCGAGGASMGYHQAGYEVVGVDIRPQPHFPFDFRLGNALDYSLWDFDLIHVSPPCQRWLGVPRALGETYPDLLTEFLRRVQASGRAFVVENIPTSPLPGFVLCGATFGLPVIRHRRFLTYPEIQPPPSLCPQHSYNRSVYHGPQFTCFAHGAWRPRWRAEVMPVLWPWMDIKETHDAIPPAYTKWIGEQLKVVLSS